MWSSGIHEKCEVEFSSAQEDEIVSGARPMVGEMKVRVFDNHKSRVSSQYISEKSSLLKSIMVEPDRSQRSGFVALGSPPMRWMRSVVPAGARDRGRCAHIVTRIRPLFSTRRASGSLGSWSRVSSTSRLAPYSYYCVDKHAGFRTFVHCGMASVSSYWLLGSRWQS